MGTFTRLPSLDARIAERAAGQRGLLRRQDLLDLGLGVKAVEYRVRSSRLLVHHPGIYSLSSGPFTRETAWLAAFWWCAGHHRPGAGHVSTLSHVSAGASRGHGPEPDVSEVHVTTTARVASRSGIVVHRTQRLDPVDWWREGPLLVTSPARTLVDEASMLAFADVRARVDRLQELPVGALEATLARHPSRPGSGAVRRLLHGEGRHTRSELERRYLAFCRSQGLPLPPELNVTVAGHQADVLHRAESFVLELDGRAYHEQRAQIDADHRRDADYQLAGYRILRLRWWDLAPEAAARTARLIRRFLGIA